MEIKRKSVESFLGPIAEDQIKVSLFIASSKNQRLKKLNLEKLSPEERQAKLNKWAQQYRFVAVIEIGDIVFANVHARHATQLQGLEDLSLNGKKVTVRALTDEEAALLSAVGEAFEEHALKDEKEGKKSPTFYGAMPRQYFSNNRLISDQMHSQHVVEQMVKSRIGTIILNCMQKYNEAQRELQKQKEADDKYFDIKKSEIKKDVLRNEIKQGEIKGQDLKQTLVKEDIQRVNQLRTG